MVRERGGERARAKIAEEKEERRRKPRTRRGRNGVAGCAAGAAGVVGSDEMQLRKPSDATGPGAPDAQKEICTGCVEADETLCGVNDV